MTAPVLVWFRHDLRLSDNAALRAAVDTGRPVIPLYVLDDESPDRWRPGGAGRWWLRHSLAALEADLRRRGARLVLRRGRASRAVLDAARESGACSVFWNEGYEPFARTAAAELAARLGEAGIASEAFAGNLLFEPGTIVSGGGRPYRVFTPFWNACRQAPPPSPPLAGVRKLRRPRKWPRSDRLDAWDLTRGAPDALGASWTPGERAAQARLRDFLESDLAAYDRHRDRPDLAATSRLSPHLHFGEIGARQIWHAVRSHEAARRKRKPTAAAASFLRQLGWREFLHHLLCMAPSMPDEPLRPEFAAFPWAKDDGALGAWQRGETGYPIVDAAMRELRRTGWMHNRMRMVAASFLVKHLLVPWQAGEAWFWERLVDADLACNAGNWQWVAGCGTDAAPYFRIFNPVRQGTRFDPKGAYTRRWVPEVAGLPERYLHRPWEAPEAVRRAAGVKLGRTYPHPVVDHAAARRRALDAFARIKRT